MGFWRAPAWACTSCRRHSACRSEYKPCIQSLETVSVFLLYNSTQYFNCAEVTSVDSQSRNKWKAVMDGFGLGIDAQESCLSDTLLHMDK